MTDSGSHNVDHHIRNSRMAVLLLLLVLLALPTAINGGSNVRGGGWAELPSDQDEEREQKPRANSETTTETTDDTSVDMDDDANVAIAITSEEDGVGADPLADGDIFTQAESIDYFKDVRPVYVRVFIYRFSHYCILP